MVTLLKRLRLALHRGEIEREFHVADLVVSAALTVVVAVLTWRVSLVTGSYLAMCALLAAPILASTRSSLAALASLLAVTAVALALLPSGSHHDIAFVFAGLTLIGAVAYASLMAGTKLAEARSAVGEMRYRHGSEAKALERAGVCAFTLSRRFGWRSISEGTWQAFGCDAGLKLGRDGMLELDDGAVTAFMHSGSRESWRLLLEAVKAELNAVSPQEGLSRSLQNRQVTLYSEDGSPRDYLFSVLVTERGDINFTGVRLKGRFDSDPDIGARLGAWLDGLAQATQGPAVVLLPDGVVVSANAHFKRLTGPLEEGADIFGINAVRGLSPTVLAAGLVAAGNNDATRLDKVTLEGGTHAATCRRLAPAFARHFEVLVMSW